ncbi:hypothetical protein ESA94_13640 [Lacibacter luteus]|uniref:Uncharacterized protein n=1 Tax=Lacibacter luteus TaxID=2508719 RepID=A0A4Q1CGA8_9BACT|nr:hypothetical protein [Lacibacter luteus]RXK59178.1 hypothetical protein ESA94_13640 [Lacibacter luteus]
MAYELALFDDFVRLNFDRTVILTEEQLQTYCNLIQEEANAVLQNFRNRVFHFNRSKQREFYVRQHQQSITRLKNQLLLFKERQVKRKDANVLKLTGTLIDVLELLLDFLKTEYPVYFDCEAAVPLHYLHKMQIQLRKDFERVMHCLERCEVEQGFQQAFRSSVEPKLDGHSQRSISFRLLDYLSLLFDQVLCLPVKSDDVFFHSAFVDLLIGMNFNTGPFCKAFVMHLKQEIHALEDKHEQLQFCLSKMHELEHFAVENITGIEPGKLSVRDAALSMFQQVLFMMEQKPVVSVTAPTIATETEPLLHLNWTVEELGLYVRLLQDNGQLVNRNLRDVAKLLSGQVRTTRKEQLSWQNIYNCFSKAEMNTMRSLDSKLMDVLNGLRRMKRG